MRVYRNYFLARGLSYLLIGVALVASSSERARDIAAIVVCIALLIGWEAWRWRRRHGSVWAVRR